MARINVGRLKRVAVDRVVEVLRSQEFRDLVEAEAAFFGIGNQPVPGPEHIFRTESDPRGIEDDPRNQEVAFFVFPETPSRIGNLRSGADNYRADGFFEVAIAGTFLPAIDEPILSGGVELDTGEVLTLRGEAYNSAVIEAVYRYACIRDQIHEVALDSNEAAPLYGDMRNIQGICTARFTVTQHAWVPARQPLSTDP